MTNEDSAQSSSLTPDGKNGDDEEGPVFETEQEELETFRSFKFPPGLLSNISQKSTILLPNFFAA